MARAGMRCGGEPITIADHQLGPVPLPDKVPECPLTPIRGLQPAASLRTRHTTDPARHAISRAPMRVVIGMRIG
jgi:hypothetical protein